MATTKPESPSLKSNVLAKLRAALDQADALVEAGKYEAAVKALRPPYGGGGGKASRYGYGWSGWEEMFKQELRERETPELDYEKIILARVAKACEAPHSLPW